MKAANIEDVRTMLYESMSLPQLIEAKFGSASALAEGIGVDGAKLDDYLDGIEPWPQDVQERAIKALDIPAAYIQKYFFIYQFDPAGLKHYIAPADYIRIRDTYANCADLRWAKDMATHYGCRPDNAMAFYAFVADVFCAGYLSAKIAARQAN